MSNIKEGETLLFCFLLSIPNHLPTPLSYTTFITILSLFHHLDTIIGSVVIDSVGDIEDDDHFDWLPVNFAADTAGD